ncbi:GFA family protein [Merismopedia glauca]|uniref:Aldehyde-activating protein n=1 Tax=Merismopedia glauca CCAP 1448/3 TaxID=1296344 RepID=A0A2T1C9B8_9CYAN|nr:GFA family protein [Merismopedia glauca]PSB04733.1 aldehyde-activating protein [Merismopedia glauca CCAP 1448/3]
MDGKCLCGAITIRTADKTSLEGCHCGMCRRWGGGPALSVLCGSDVQIDGFERLKVYKSSEWAERAFCSECGTHMFYRLLATNEYFVPAGLFPNEIEFEFKEQIFIDRKPSYYEFANQTLKMTEAEVFAKFASIHT